MGIGRTGFVQTPSDVRDAQGSVCTGLLAVLRSYHQMAGAACFRNSSDLGLVFKCHGTEHFFMSDLSPGLLHSLSARLTSLELRTWI
ncbi:hypothetical protein WJX73_009157 [Symbiochloris irregularis]|uniref:Uncharacterized protein n=1 Tax=Symbiochloris irregularis TaxID=706552 RepID=A0AAW1NLS4_9CHLO